MTSLDNYCKWDTWSDEYDSDGDEMEMNLKVPLDDVSAEYLKSIDFNDVSAECGKPMTQEEFDAYRHTRDTAPTILHA